MVNLYSVDMGATPQVGLRGPQDILADSRKRLAAAQQAQAPKAPTVTGPYVGYNPVTKELFSGGKTIAPGYDGFKAAASGGLLNISNQQLPEGFLPLSVDRVHAKVMRDVGRNRELGVMATDTAREGISSFVSGVKSISDFVSPGNNPVSNFLGESIIDPIAAHQSDSTKYQKDMLSQGLNSSELGTQASAVGTYLANRPVAAIAQGVGSLVGIGGIGAGARGLAGLAGLGAKGIARAGTYGVMGGSAAMGGGDAGQSAYDKVMNAPELANVPTEQRQEMAFAAARKASVPGAIVGGIAGRFGAEGALGRGLGGAKHGVWRTAGEEGLSEFVEEGTGALSSNLAAQQYAPSIDAGRGVFGQALMGGVIGTVMGGAVGAMRRQPVDLLNPAPVAPPATPPAASPLQLGYTPPTSGQIGYDAPPLLGDNGQRMQISPPPTPLDRDRSAEQSARWGAPTQQPLNLPQHLSDLLGAQDVGQQWQDIQQNRNSGLMAAQDIGQQSAAMFAGKEQADTDNQANVSAAMAPVQGLVRGAKAAAARGPATRAAKLGQEFQDVMSDKMLGEQADIVEMIPEFGEGEWNSSALPEPGTAPVRPVTTKPATSSALPVGKAAPSGPSSKLSDKPVQSPVSSPSEGSATAVAPSVTPAASAPASFSPPTRESFKKSTRSEVGLFAQNLGIQITGKPSKQKMLDMIDAHYGRAPAASPVAPATTEQAPTGQTVALTPEEQELADAIVDENSAGAGMAATNNALKSAVQSMPGGKPKGKITVGRNIMAGIVRSLRKVFDAETGGTPAVPVVYVDGTAKTDKDLTKQYADQMTAMRDAALSVANAYKTLSSLGANVVVSDSKIGRTTPGTRTKKAAERVPQLVKAQQELRTAVESFIEASGSAANANALVAAFKTRVQTEMAKNAPDTEKADYWKSLDVNLSRAWKMYNDGQLQDTENLVNVSTGEKRNAWEIQKKEAEAEPLVKAAEEGAKRHSRAEKEAGILGVLSYIQAHGNTPYERMLAGAVARALRGHTKQPKVAFDVGPGEHASYTPATDTIHLSKTASAEVSLHEALHAALQWVVYTKPNHASVLRLHRAVKDLVAYDRSKLTSENAKAAYDIIAGLANKGTKNDLNAALLELVSYGTTMPDFAAALRKIPSTQDQQFTSLATKLFDMVSKLLQQFLGVTKTVANDVMDATARLLEEAAVTDDATTRAKAFGEEGVSKGNKLNAAVRKSFARVADFWQRVAATGEAALFRTNKIHPSYRTQPRADSPSHMGVVMRAMGMTPENNWDLSRVSEERKTGMNPPSGGKTVDAWQIFSPKNGTGYILVDDRGQVTVQTPGMSEGTGEGQTILQAALSYAWLNRKTFIGEDAKFDMSDVAVHKYTEAMMSSALRYGSTDFMVPSRRQMDPTSLIPRDYSEDKFLSDAKELGWSLEGWQTADAEGTVESRMLHNVALMAKMVSSMVFAKNPQLADYTYTPGEGFFDGNGNRKQSLPASHRRAIIANTVSTMTDSEALGASAGLAMNSFAQNMEEGTMGVLQAKASSGGVLYAAAQSGPVSASGLPMSAAGTVNPAALSMGKYAQTTAWLEPVFRTVLPMVYGPNATLTKQAVKFASDSAAALRKASPKLAAYISAFNPDFNVVPALTKFIAEFKSGRHAPTTSAHEFGRWIQGATQPEIIAAFDYMDALAANPKATAKGVEDHVQTKVQDALRAVQAQLDSIDPTSDVGLVYSNLKPSEMLTHALQLDSVGSSAFGAQDARVLAGRKITVSLQDIKAPTGPGGIMRTGKFHPIYADKASGDTTVVGMIHESELTKAGAKADPNVDETRIARLEKVDPKTSDARFREITTAAGLFADKSLGHAARDTVATSFLNTVSILSNAVATRKLTTDMAAHSASLPANEQYVFAGQAELDRHLYGAKSKQNAHVFELSDKETKSTVIRDEYRKPGTWVKLPASEAYGDLAGKIVPGPVWTRISDAMNRTSVIDSQMYNGMMRTFKGMKTKYSPSTMATNIMGNFTLAYMNNLPFNSVRDALHIYLKYKVTPGRCSPEELQLMSAFHASGATLGDWSTNEIKQLMYEAMAGKSEVSGVGFFNTLADLTKYHGSLVEKVTEYVKHKGGRVDDLMSDAYATGDNMFRLAAFMSKYGELQKTNPGMSEAERMSEAGQFAKEQFLDYDTDARAVNIMRQTMLPFVSFTYAYTGRLADVAAKQPWKLATIALVYSMVASALNAAFSTGSDDEDRKRRQRAKMDGTTWFGANRQWLVGKTDSGQDVYFDAARWFTPTPLSFTDNPNGFMGIHSFPSSITPNNPFITSLMYMFGFDPYLGKSILKETATNGEDMAVIAKKIGGTFSPPWAGKLAGPTPGVIGASESYYTHYARAALLPVKSIDDAQATRGLQMDIRRTMRAYDAEISAMHRAGITGKITPEERDEAIAKLRERRMAKIEELRKGL